jgi:tryptophan 2,3-dioxygenase
MLRQSTYWDHSVPIDLLLELSMLPVYVNHEEYNFIRILQSFEAIFSIVIVGLQAVINCVYDDRIREASRILKLLCDIFRIDVSLFRILMTMPREDFHIFRQYTEGASAIQSPQYKMIEVLMGSPSTTRWDSPAFKFVPQIRLFLERTGLNLELVLRERFGRNGEGFNLDGVNDEQTLVLFQRINTLDRMFLDWKKCHFGIANHMIGSDTGTGGSDVIEYLGRFKGELFFSELDKALSQRDLGGYIHLLDGEEYHCTKAQVPAKPPTTPDLSGAEGEANDECN